MSTNTIHDDELQHWGVKGMRWGVRKARGTSSESGGGKKSKKSKIETDTQMRELKKSNRAKRRVNVLLATGAGITTGIVAANIAGRVNLVNILGELIGVNPWK